MKNSQTNLEVPGRRHNHITVYILYTVAVQTAATDVYALDGRFASELRTNVLFLYDSTFFQTRRYGMLQKIWRHMNMTNFEIQQHVWHGHRCYAKRFEVGYTTLPFRLIDSTQQSASSG